MKKMIALLAALLLCVGCACAEGATGIMFQNRPWGSSAEEIAQWLLEEGIVTNQYHICDSKMKPYLQDSWLNEAYMHEDGSVTQQNEYAKTVQMLVANEWLNREFKVAGYTLENLYLFFACQEDASQLISVVLDFNFPNGQDAAFADLQQKLRTVYGPGDEDDETHYLKLGDGNTAVHLFSTNKPMLMYGDTSATVKLSEIHVESNGGIDSTDVSGL